MSMELELNPLTMAATIGAPGLAPAGVARRERTTSLSGFLITQGLGQGADAAVTLTLAHLVVFSIENGATPATVVKALLTAVLPSLVSLPVAELVSDRCRRHRTLAVVQVARAVVALAAIAVPLTGSARLGYVTVMALMSVAGISHAVRSAALPHVVAPHRLVVANSWASLTGKIAGSTGALAVLAIGRHHPVAMLVVAGAVHLIGAARYAAWPGDLGGGAPTSVHGMAEVLRRAAQLITRAPVRRPVLSAIARRALQGATLMAFVVIADERLHLGTSGYATAIAAAAIGTVAGTTVVAPLLRRHSCTWLELVTWGAAAASLLVAGAMLSLISGVVALVVLAATFQAARLVADSAVQLAVGDDALGRVYSLYDASYHVAMLLGAAVAFSLPGLNSLTAFVVLGGLHTAAAAICRTARVSPSTTIPYEVC